MIRKKACSLTSHAHELGERTFPGLGIKFHSKIWVKISMTGDLKIKKKLDVGYLKTES